MCQFQEEQRDINTYLEYSGFGEEVRQVSSEERFSELLIGVSVVDDVVVVVVDDVVVVGDDVVVVVVVVVVAVVVVDVVVDVVDEVTGRIVVV